MTASLTIDDPVLATFADEVGSEGPVAVAGGRTRWSVGGPLAAGTREVVAPTGIVEYVPDEMTVRVRAGTPVAELHASLAASGQRTALPERGGTVGGAVAVGENDLRVLGRGRVRASVLQVRYVSAEGRLVSGGGPTVKNVSGFDLPRLLTGSLGTLGLLAEVIVRSNPIPDTSVWLVAEGVDPFAIVDVLYRPSAVLWDGVRLFVQLEGHRADVDAEQRVLAAHGSFAAAEGPPVCPAHRWSLRPADLRRLDTEDTGPFVASIGVGTVFASNPPPRPSVDPGAIAVAARMKHEFDPTGRLAPGRNPAVR